MVAYRTENPSNLAVMPPGSDGAGAACNQGGNTPGSGPARGSATWNGQSAPPERAVILALCAWLAILLIFTVLGRPPLSATSVLVLQALLALSAAGLGACLVRVILGAARRTRRRP